MEAAPGTLQKGRMQIMSRRSEEQGAIVKGVFSDAYRFYLKYHGRPLESGFWDEATNDFSSIMKKYNGATICGRIMLAAFSQLEEEVR